MSARDDAAAAVLGFARDIIRMDVLRTSGVPEPDPQFGLIVDQAVGAVLAHAWTLTAARRVIPNALEDAPWPSWSRKVAERILKESWI